MTALSEDVTTRLTAAHEAATADAVALAEDIYARPELSLHEFHAHEVTTELLRHNGFDVTTVPGLATAFVATLDSGRPGPEIGLLAEYDALPEIGHACGHHLIAGSAVHAGLALRSVLADLGGTVKVFGCPAEERGIGKVVMLDAGVFDRTSATLTFHAYHSSTVMVSSNGVRQLSLEFSGKAAHAAEAPWQGASALDGVVQTFQSVAALRQFLRDGSRLHGIITDGGQALNVIPERASCLLAARSTDAGEIEVLERRLREAAEAAARATGTEVRIEDLVSIDPVRWNGFVDAAVRRAFVRAGEPVADWAALASTDFGNVSQRVPSALFSVATWPREVAFHSREATHYAGLPFAFDAMVRGGGIMALAGAELLQSGEELRGEGLAAVSL
ncbi:amidohydrolase [Amycolatopsis jejuensis]|uniref:amidohydrolase n=1 Tax=Amycolatopsis jejuensis TaxID=330084 RepID=UPI000690467E|nr:amidohydrolase [Amycolatopsis jejuensis]